MAPPAAGVLEKTPMDLVDLANNPIPAGCRLEMISTSDGIRLRTARWPAPPGAARGTVCLFPGWSETIEKYFHVVERLRQRGFAVAILEWRGQGGSSRLADDPLKGHVRSFRHYLRDIEAFRRKVVLPDCPPPYFALGHSMGGGILLSAGRFLAPTFERLVLTAPMLGLPQPAAAPGFRRFCLRLAVYCGAGGRYIPGQRRRTASARTFERNPLTSDPERYRINEAISAARPVCRLAAPTLGWVAAATRMFDRLAAPGLAEAVPAPVMLVNSGADTVVSRLAIETMARRLRNPAYVLIHGARHEVMMEREVYAAQFWAAFDAFIPGSSE